MRLIYFILAVFVGIFAPHAHAISEFTTDYRGLYQIQQDGSTYVTHTISLKNNLSHIFPKEYTLSIGNNDLQELQATDGSGNPLPIFKQDLPTQTSLNVQFVDQNIGHNQENMIRISYKTNSLVIYQNNAWEINIPRLKQGSEMSSVERQIVFPPSLGTPTVAYPTPDQVSSDANATTIIYRTSRQEPIRLLFGESQWYQLALTYFLTPPLSKNSVTEISLPPDTPYQQIVIQNLTPAPQEIVVDPDGNWLARYPYQENFPTKIVAEIFAQISPVPKFYDPSKLPLPEHTKPNKYWESNATNVKLIAEQLNSPENIYDYLVSTLTYNTNRVAPGADRFGAAKALNTPSMAICTEFTDAFVALSRAKHIPARSINGYAITTNSELRPLSLETDVLHAWPEFYDDKTKSWLAVDPTWGNTTGGLNYFHKLDYNHITFVRHGLEPSYPYPAGVYKQSVSDKTVEVIPSNTTPQIIKKYDITKTGSGYRIKNTGNVALINDAVSLPDKSTHLVEYLPPYATIESSSILGDQASSKNIIFIILVFALFILITTLVIYLTKRRTNTIT